MHTLRSSTSTKDFPLDNFEEAMQVFLLLGKRRILCSLVLKSHLRETLTWIRVLRTRCHAAERYSVIYFPWSFMYTLDFKREILKHYCFETNEYTFQTCITSISYLLASLHKREGIKFSIYGDRVTQRLSDLPRVTGESVVGTEQGALTQRHLLSAQGNATQLLCSLKPGLSHPLLMTPTNSQWVSVCHEFSKTPRKIMDFKNQLYQQKITLRKGGLRGKHTPTCVRQRPYEQTPPRHVSHLLYHPFPSQNFPLEHLLTHNRCFCILRSQ